MLCEPRIVKTILIPITSNFFIRNFLRTDTARILAARSDIRLVLLAAENKVAYYRREFPLPNVEFAVLPDVRRSGTERLFSFLETASIHSRTTAMLHSWRLHRTRSQVVYPVRLAAFVMRRTLWHIGKFRIWRQAIRGAYDLAPSRAMRAVFDRYRPDLVFAATMLPRDAAVLKEAKKRRIKTVGMVLSWDNLYNKTLLRVHTDTLLVHTNAIREQAVTRGDYPRERITIVGIPQYDDYFRRSRIVPRKEFMVSIGADPSKKLILYGFSGKAGLAIDYDIVDILAHAVRQGEIRKPVEVLLRPYPRYDFADSKLAVLRGQYGFLAESSAAHVGGGKESWEFDDRAISFLANSLAHADIVITMYSTFFIEAAIFDKPLIAIAFDGRQTADYWNSAGRFFDWDHLRPLKAMNGIWRVESREELVRAINAYLENPSCLHKGREEIVRTQCQFTDGKSGMRVADALLRLL